VGTTTRGRIGEGIAMTSWEFIVTVLDGSCLPELPAGHPAHVARAGIADRYDQLKTSLSFSDAVRQAKAEWLRQYVESNTLPGS
jgi:hypothetical protein